MVEQATATAITASADLVAYVATLPNLLIAAAAWSLIQVLSKVFPRFAGSKLGQRLKPGAALVLCVLGCFVPGVQPASMAAGNKLLLGVILGSLAGQAHKVLKQGIFGHGAGREPKGKIERLIT